MSNREHLQFLVLMIPTFLILVAAAVSMAGLGGAGLSERDTVTVSSEESQAAL